MTRRREQRWRGRTRSGPTIRQSTNCCRSWPLIRQCEARNHVSESGNSRKGRKEARQLPMAVLFGVDHRAVGWIWSDFQGRSRRYQCLYESGSFHHRDVPLDSVGFPVAADVRRPEAGTGDLLRFPHGNPGRPREHHVLLLPEFGGAGLGGCSHEWIVPLGHGRGRLCGSPRANEYVSEDRVGRGLACHLSPQPLASWVHQESLPCTFPCGWSSHSLLSCSLVSAVSRRSSPRMRSPWNCHTSGSF